jgi:hypothetical protein
VKVLGATFRDATLAWALMERTAPGWAIADAGVHEGATLRIALASARRRFPKIRPRVGIGWGVAELFVGTNEPAREISAAVRIETNERDRVVSVNRHGSRCLVAHAARAEVAAVLDAWRSCGIDPRGAEPPESAWLRTVGWDAPVLNLLEGPGYLLVARPDRLERYRFERSGAEDYQAIALLIRRARHEVGAVDRIIAIGAVPPGLANEEAGVAFEEFSALGIASPPWADAVALASAGYGRELQLRGWLAGLRAGLRKRARASAASSV